MLGREDEAAVQADAYIDALLAAHAGRPAIMPGVDDGPSAQLRRTIELLESRLPRFHPSFRFEEALASRLRAAATAGPPSPSAGRGDIAQLPIASPLPGLAAGAVIDRRLLVGGAALASGVSLAGAAMLVRAQRRGRTRSRREWLS